MTSHSLLIAITTVMHTKGNCSYKPGERYWPYRLLAEGRREEDAGSSCPWCERTKTGHYLTVKTGSSAAAIQAIVKASPAASGPRLTLFSDVVCVRGFNFLYSQPIKWQAVIQRISQNFGPLREVQG